MNPDPKTRIVVVGGGAGGLELVSRLGRKLPAGRFDVVLVDRNATQIHPQPLNQLPNHKSVRRVHE